MKKKIFTLLLVGMSLAAAGCSQKKGEGVSTETEQRPAEIVYSNDAVDLAEYKDLSVSRTIYTVSEEDIEEEIQSALYEYAEYPQVERASREGDYVAVKFTGTAAGETVVGSDGEEQEFLIGEEEYGAEFDKKLTGVKSGDVLDFSVAYTEETANEENGLAELSGQTVDYHVEVTGVSEEVLPDYTDEFVKENLDAESREEYEKNLRESLEQENKETSDSEVQDALINQVIAASNIKEYSDDLYQNYYDSVKSDYESMAEMWGISGDEMMESFDLTEEDIKEEALNYLYRDLVIAAIAEAEELTVSEKELDEGAEKLAKENEYEDVEALLEDYEEDTVRQYVLEQKVLDLLVEHADITEVPAE